LVVIVDKKRIDGMMVLSIEGIIKLGRSAEFLAENLKSILDTERGHVLLDLSQINYIDSTGIGELVAYLGRFAESGRNLVLVNPSERIRKLLAIAQLEQLFTIYGDLDSALAAERGVAAAGA
jgi:anti-sigma B factor antagonist